MALRITIRNNARAKFNAATMVKKPNGESIEFSQGETIEGQYDPDEHCIWIERGGQILYVPKTVNIKIRHYDKERV